MSFSHLFPSLSQTEIFCMIAKVPQCPNGQAEDRTHYLSITRLIAILTAEVKSGYTMLYHGHSE
jgi:hypothetical protein